MFGTHTVNGGAIGNFSNAQMALWYNSAIEKNQVMPGRLFYEVNDQIYQFRETIILRCIAQIQLYVIAKSTIEFTLCVCVSACVYLLRN